MPTAGPDTAVILCGGRGTRLQEHNQTLPKPLVEIGGWPIVWHVVRIYAAQGFRRFVLPLGHRLHAAADGFGEVRRAHERVVAAAHHDDIAVFC